MFRTFPLSIVRSFSLYTQQWHMSCRSADSLRAGSGGNWFGTKPVPSWSCSQAVSRPVWHIPLLCVQWKTPDDGQRNCPKHVEFYKKYYTSFYNTTFILYTLVYMSGPWHIYQCIFFVCCNTSGWKTSNVEFYSKNKFEKLVNLFGFIIRNFWYRCYKTPCKWSRSVWNILVQNNTMWLSCL